MHDPSLNHSRLLLGCFLGTFRPSPRQIRSTRLWFTRLSKNRLVQLGIGQEPLQTGILLLKILEPLRLVDPQTPELLLPSVEGLLGDTDLLDRLRDRLASPLPLPRPLEAEG